MRGKIPANAFDLYFSLGPSRSHQKIAQRFGVSKKAVTKRAIRDN